MDRNQALQNIAKKGKTEVALLEVELKEIITTMPDSPDRERLALRELNNRYSGPEDDSGKFDICIVGVNNLTDFNRKTLADGMTAYKSNQEQALESGLVKMIEGEATVMDLKETFGDNIKNANYGKPLGHSWNRNLVILARPTGEETWAIVDNVAFRGDFANATLPEMYKVIKCNLLGDIAKGLKSSRTTKFHVTDEAVDINSVLMALAKDKVMMLGDCFDEAKKHTKTDKGYYQRFVITSGEVKYMNEPKKEGGNYSGTVDDFTTDQMVQVFVDPKAGKPVIGEEYTFIAQTTVKPSYVKETKSNTGPDQLIMNILGFYQS